MLYPAYNNFYHYLEKYFHKNSLKFPQNFNVFQNFSIFFQIFHLIPRTHLFEFSLNPQILDVFPRIFFKTFFGTYSNYSKSFLKIFHIIFDKFSRFLMFSLLKISSIFFQNFLQTFNIFVKMKQVSYSGKYSLLASRANQSHLQFLFLVMDAFCPCFFHV